MVSYGFYFTLVLLLYQTPPNVALDNCVVAPTVTVEVPFILAGDATIVCPLIFAWILGM